jgi:hypothetical protein
MSNSQETPLSDVKVVPIDETIADPNRFHHQKSGVVQMGETLAEGQLPSNAAVTHEIDNATAYLKERENAGHTAAEQKIIKDVRVLAETAKETIESKNRDDLAQKFVADVAKLAEKAKNAGPTVTSSTDVIIQTSKFADAARNLLMAAAKSPNFRKSLIDLTTVVKHVFQRVDTSKLESAVRDPKSGVTDIAGAAKDTAQDFKDKNQQEGAPQSERKVREDVKRFLQELNQNPEAHEAYKALINLWNMLNAEFYNVLDKAINDADVARVFDEARQIVEAYAGGRSLELFLLRIRCIIGLIALDQDLQNYIKSVQQYAQKALDNPALIEQDSYYDEGKALFDQGRGFAEKYKNDPDLQALLDESAALAVALGNDEQVKRLQTKAEKLANDLTYTGVDGKAHLDTDFVSLIRTEVVPFITNRIKEIPVPGFQLESDDFHHLIVDDIYVTVEDLVPDRIKISSAESAELKINDEDPLKTRAFIDIKVDGVRLRIKDFYFNFKRKTPIGNVSDEGRANLSVKGDGLHLHIRYEISIDAKRGVPALQNAQVTVKLDNVDVDVIEANHKTMLNMVTSLFSKKIESDVENTIKIKIEEAGQDLAELLNKQVISNISPTGLAGLIRTNLASGV